MNKRISSVLVVDDDPSVRLTLEVLLEGAGYHVDMAENGLDGFKKAKEIYPDVILLDVMMPGMDGYEVCRKLRADTELAEVPIFMITTLDDRASRLAGMAAGADDFLSKPFDSLELEIRLNMLKRVDRYRLLLDERKKLTKALAELEIKNEKLRQLSQQVLTAQENERRNLALELHDEIGETLTGLKLLLERPDLKVDEQFELARSITNELFRRVREMALDLRPSILDDFGLSAALDDLFKRLARTGGLIIHHNIDPFSERRFDRSIEIAVFRVVQEALTNVSRHAGVGEALVTLDMEPGTLHLSISDSGKGFEPNALVHGHSSGISGMEERVTLAGGSFSLQSAPNDGTLILVHFDLISRK